MDIKPMLSIVVPCYNHEKYVSDCLYSVVNQPYDDYELYIVNDGSDDNSADVIEDFMERHLGDARLHFCNYKENTYFTWHDEVISLLNGQYVAIISADDYISSDRFEKQIDFLEKHRERYKACFSWIKVIDAEGNVDLEYESSFQKKNSSRMRKIKNLVTYTNHIAAPTMMMDLAVYKELGGYDFYYKQLQDYDLWLRFLLKYDFYIIPEKLTIYRVLESSISNSGDFSVSGRFNYELNDVLYRYVKNMPNDIFIKAFELNNISSDDDIKVKLKKINLFLDIGSETYTDVGIRLLGEYVRDDDFRRELERNGMNPRKLYHKLVGERSVYARMIKDMIQMMQIKEELNSLK